MPKMRRSIITSKDLEKGNVIKEDDLTFKRPGTGIEPDQEAFVIGRTLKHSLAKDSVLRWTDFE